MNRTNAVNVSLTFLLLLRLINIPSRFYQFVRFSTLVGFANLGYAANDEKTKVLFYIALAILFQPFIKIALGRTYST